jgi:hypothetical protein
MPLPRTLCNVIAALLEIHCNWFGLSKQHLGNKSKAKVDIHITSSFCSLEHCNEPSVSIKGKKFRN